MSELQCVVVTPERTEVDVKAESVTIPLFDGELGILKGHSPLVGRLGFGELRIKLAGGENKNYFIEGGFVQVANNVVSVLTDRLAESGKISREAAKKAMDSAIAMPRGRADAIAARDKATARAQAMLRLAERK